MRNNFYVSLVFILIATIEILCCGWANAQKLEVDLGLRVDSMATSISGQKPEYLKLYTFSPLYTQSTDLTRKTFINDVAIKLKAESSGASDLSCGAHLYLHANASPSSGGEAYIGDKFMVHLQHNKLGRIEIGSYPSAGAIFEMSDMMHSAVGYGVFGYWSTLLNDVAHIDLTDLGVGYIPLSGIQGFKYLMTPNLPSNYSPLYYSDAPKVTYYTKLKDDFTFGISYIPDLDNTGSIAGVANEDGGPVDSIRGNLGYRSTFKNIINGGIHYKWRYGLVEFVNVISAETGKAKKFAGAELIHNLKAYEVGMFGTYEDFTLGATYGDWGKTGTYKMSFPNTKVGKSKYWTAIAHKRTKKFDITLSYMQSHRRGGLEAVGSELIRKVTGFNFANPRFSDTNDNKLAAISGGVQYKIIDGVAMGAELTRFKFSDSGGAIPNSGLVALVLVRVEA